MEVVVAENLQVAEVVLGKPLVVVAVVEEACEDQLEVVEAVEEELHSAEAEVVEVDLIHLAVEEAVVGAVVLEQ